MWVNQSKDIEILILQFRVDRTVSTKADDGQRPIKNCMAKAYHTYLDTRNLNSYNLYMEIYIELIHIFPLFQFSSYFNKFHKK